MKPNIVKRTTDYHSNRQKRYTAIFFNNKGVKQNRKNYHCCIKNRDDYLKSPFIGFCVQRQIEHIYNHNRTAYMTAVCERSTVKMVVIVEAKANITEQRCHIYNRVDTNQYPKGRVISFIVKNIAKNQYNKRSYRVAVNGAKRSYKRYLYVIVYRILKN